MFCFVLGGYHEQCHSGEGVVGDTGAFPEKMEECGTTCMLRDRPYLAGKVPLLRARGRNRCCCLLGECHREKFSISDSILL